MAQKPKKKTLAQIAAEAAARRRRESKGTKVVTGSKKSRPITRSYEDVMAARKALKKLPKSATAGQKKRKVGMPFGPKQLKEALAKRKKKR
jgi:hypothetical protein